MIFPTDYAMPMTELGPAAEERGFESLWVAEHSHIPTCRTSPWPGGGELPAEGFHDRVEQSRREILAEALAAHDGNQTRAAEALGLQRTYLARLIKKYGL